MFIKKYLHITILKGKKTLLNEICHNLLFYIYFLKAYENEAS